MEDFKNKIADSNVSQEKEKNTKDVIELTLATLIEKAVDGLLQSTEIPKRKSMALAILQSDDCFAEFINEYYKNQKHIKRKREKALINVIKDLGAILSNRLNSIEQNENTSVLSKMFRNG